MTKGGTRKRRRECNERTKAPKDASKVMCISVRYVSVHYPSFDLSLGRSKKILEPKSEADGNIAHTGKKKWFDSYRETSLPTRHGKRIHNLV